MKNTLGGQFYFFQARRGGPTRVPPAPQSAIRYMGPGAMSTSVGDSTITTDFALTLDFVPYILQAADATFSLVHAFLWDRFGLG